MKTYLAGPIFGCTDDEAANWRDVAKARLGADNCIDPMDRDYRGREDECVDEIVDGDKYDIARSNFVLANCWTPSWGTSMEVHYAYTIKRPVIAVVQPGSKVSPWLRYHAAAVFESLDDALALIEKME